MTRMAVKLPDIMSGSVILENILSIGVLEWLVILAGCKDIGIKLELEARESKNSSVIRQKGESQNGCFKKTKHAKFSEKCSFFGKFGVLCFLETPVLRFALSALLPTN